MSDVTAEQAFKLGFFLKLANDRIDPSLVDDTCFVLEKTASILVPLLFGGAMALPSLLKAIANVTVDLPHTIGSLAGAHTADTVARATEPSKEEAVMRKIINDYKLQTEGLKASRANEIASDILKRKRTTSPR